MESVQGTQHTAIIVPRAHQSLQSQINGYSPTESLIQEFPSVFDSKEKPMEGEQFHIALTDDTKLFCVHTPRAIPYAYREKL